MTVYTAELDLAAAFDRPVRCPSCGQPSLRLWPGTDAVTVCCPDCSRFWLLDAGGALRAVQPPTGGEDRSRCESD